MARRTIEELKQLQRDVGMTDVHLVELDEAGFTVAHTDAERAERDRGGDGLEECSLHRFLFEQDGPPAATGVVLVATEHAYSEPYGADPWELEPLRRCRQCGCTDGAACLRVAEKGEQATMHFRGVGHVTCGWAEEDLCTACLPDGRVWLQPEKAAV